MKIIQELESILLDGQHSTDLAKSGIDESNDSVNSYLQTIRSYAEMEGAIVVLSDLINIKSYVCVGALGNQFGFKADINRLIKIDSIWEEEIFNKIHPDDLFQKYILELKYCHFLKKRPTNERSRYSTDTRIRMLNINGQYQYVNHRTIYYYNSSGDTLLFGTCLYKTSLNQTLTEGINGKILDKEKGLAVEHKKYNDCSDLLSLREKEVLSCIQKGYLSKEIAGILGISQNTVNRHRQNILQKTGVNNSFEAIKIAEAMDLL